MEPMSSRIEVEALNFHGDPQMLFSDDLRKEILKAVLEYDSQYERVLGGAIPLPAYYRMKFSISKPLDGPPVDTSKTFDVVCTIEIKRRATIAHSAGSETKEFEKKLPLESAPTVAGDVQTNHFPQTAAGQVQQPSDIKSDGKRSRAQADIDDDKDDGTSLFVKASRKLE